MRRRRTSKAQAIKKARIIYSEDHLGYLIFTPWISNQHNKNFNEELKFLPEKLVRFEPDVKAWVIFPEDLDCAKELVYRYFGEFDFLPADPSQSSSFNLPTTSVTGSDFETIFRIAGEELSNKFYRMIAQNVHPRTENDSHHKSAELNAAWTNIKRSGIWR